MPPVFDTAVELSARPCVVTIFDPAVNEIGAAMTSVNTC